eukprot:366354-Chlamydomonas_euryale.AAC.2
MLGRCASVVSGRGSGFCALTGAPAQVCPEEADPGGLAERRVAITDTFQAACRLWTAGNCTSVTEQVTTIVLQRMCAFEAAHGMGCCLVSWEQLLRAHKLGRSDEVTPKFHLSSKLGSTNVMYAESHTSSAKTSMAIDVFHGLDYT